MEQIKETQDLLHEQGIDALNGIDTDDIAGEAAENAVANAIKIVDREIEIQKMTNDHEVKLAQVEADKEVKLQQIEADKESKKSDRIWGGVKFGIGLFATAALSLYSYYQEEKGTIITTQQGKRDTRFSVMDFFNRNK